MIRRPPRSTRKESSAASDVYKRQEGSYVNIKTKGKSIIMEPAEPVADKYYGAFKITQWPEDIDEFTVEVMQKWWISHAT